MPDAPQETLLDFNSAPASPTNEDALEEQRKKADERILALQQQQKSIENERKELEALARKQSVCLEGRSEMLEKLGRGIAVLDREIEETRKRMELLETTEAAFRKHRQQLEQIDARSWDDSSGSGEVARALAAVDDARLEYSKSFPKIAALAREEESTVATSRDFLEWLKAGLAFTAPLSLLGIAILYVLIRK
jgi:chromosome segregation ATPase